jgi:hypothetical protein
MIGPLWNIRGLNKSGRIKCLSNFIRQHNLYFVGIQETKKMDFNDSLLNTMSNSMEWRFLPAVGTSGGILVGIKAQSMEIISWCNFTYSRMMMIRNYSDNLVWRLIVVYGPPYDEHKLDFVAELDLVMSKCLVPLWWGRL